MGEASVEMVISSPRGHPIESVTVKVYFTELTFIRMVTVGFGILYGSTKVGLSQTLGVSQETAQFYIDRWYETFKGVARFMQECSMYILQNGYMSTYSGRRRYIEVPYDIMSFEDRLKCVNKSDMQAQIRQLTNMRIQGTSADITKAAMVKIYQAIKKYKLNAKIVCQIHDEIVVKSKEEDMYRTAELVEQCMYDEIKNDYGIMPITSKARATYSLSKAAENMLKKGDHNEA